MPRFASSLNFVRFFSAAAALWVVSQAAPALAAHRRVAVLRVDFQGEMPDNNKDFMSARLIEGLAAAEFQPFAGRTVSQLLRQGSRLESCRQADCYQEIAQRLGVEYLVTAVVTVEKKTYDVTLELVNGRDGKAIGQSHDRCELCGIKEVGTQMDRQVGNLRGYAEAAQASAPARFSIESRPVGAQVTVDSKLSGVTPLSVDVPAGAHQLTVQAEGFQPSQRNVYVDSGMNGFVAVDLTPNGVSSLGGGGGGGVPRWLAITSMVVGVAAITGGAILQSHDGEFVKCLSPVGAAKAGCALQQQRETSLESGVLIGAGSILAASGVVMLFVGPAETGHPESHAMVFGAQGRF